jgi:hypothetical protein
VAKADERGPCLHTHVGKVLQHLVQVLDDASCSAYHLDYHAMLAVRLNPIPPRPLISAVWRWPPPLLAPVHRDVHQNSQCRLPYGRFATPVTTHNSTRIVTAVAARRRELLDSAAPPHRVRCVCVSCFMLMFDVSRCMQSLLEVEDYSIRLRPEDLRLIIRLLVDQLIESNLPLRCAHRSFSRAARVT